MTTRRGFLHNLLFGAGGLLAGPGKKTREELLAESGVVVLTDQQCEKIMQGVADLVCDKLLNAVICPPITLAPAPDPFFERGTLEDGTPWQTIVREDIGGYPGKWYDGSPITPLDIGKRYVSVIVSDHDGTSTSYIPCRE